MRFQSAYWNGLDYGLGMFDASGRVLGGLGLHPRVPLNPSALDVGYWVRTSDAGRGCTTLAVQMALVLAFDWFGCDRVQVSHDEANVGSRHRLYGLTSDDLATPGEALPWMQAVRAGMTVVDAMGEPRRGA